MATQADAERTLAHAPNEPRRSRSISPNEPSTPAPNEPRKLPKVLLSQGFGSAVFARSASSSPARSTSPRPPERTQHTRALGLQWDYKVPKMEPGPEQTRQP